MKHKSDLSDQEDVKVKAGFVGQRMIIIPKKILNDVAKNPLIGRLYITDIGFFPKALHHYRERKSGSAQHILIYCAEGRGTVRIYDKEITINPGEYILIPPKTRHAYSAVKKYPWSIYWLHFTGPHAEILFKKYVQDSTSKGRKAPVWRRQDAIV